MKNEERKFDTIVMDSIFALGISIVVCAAVLPSALAISVPITLTLVAILGILATYIGYYGIIKRLTANGVEGE